jgi:hypothetical protein
LKGNTLNYKFKIFDTIENVKAKIQNKMQIPPDQYYFTFEGTRLDDDSTLEDCNLIRDSTLWMVFIVFVCININLF